MENCLTVLTPTSKKLSSVHTHDTRASASNHLSENTLVNSDTYGKNMLKFIGPRVFNEIVQLDFYKRCNNKVGFKTNMKNFLLLTNPFSFPLYIFDRFPILRWR